MRILLKSVIIIESLSEFNGRTKDILIENGIIQQISDELEIVADYIISGENLYVSAGWVDMRVSSKDPGYESKEDLITLSK